MPSQINTNSINVNFPVPGQNNSSQGFRTNFSATKNNLDTAATEISDLQGKVIVKSALNGQSLDNNMNNTLLKNARIQGFRSVAYNLGTNLSGVVNIDVSIADVHYGTITGDTQFTFTNWPPAVPEGGEGVIQLDLTFANTTASITFPAEVKVTGDWGAQSIENFVNVAGSARFTVPAGVTRLEFQLVTQDCGATVMIQPQNRPRQASQIQQRTPTAIGLPGDKSGTVWSDSTYLYVCVEDWDGTTSIWRRVVLGAF